MTVGLHTVNMANKVLDVLSGTTFTGVTTYLQLHTGDPGGAGTANTISPDPTRKAISWSAAADGSKAISATVSWTSWASGTEVVSHVSIWSADTGGTVYWTGELTTPKAVNDGDTLNITSLTLALTPLMA